MHIVSVRGVKYGKAVAVRIDGNRGSALEKPRCVCCGTFCRNCFQTVDFPRNINFAPREIRLTRLPCLLFKFLSGNVSHNNGAAHIRKKPRFKKFAHTVILVPCAALGIHNNNTALTDIILNLLCLFFGSYSEIGHNNDFVLTQITVRRRDVNICFQLILESAVGIEKFLVIGSVNHPSLSSPTVFVGINRRHGRNCFRIGKFGIMFFQLRRKFSEYGLRILVIHSVTGKYAVRRLFRPARRTAPFKIHCCKCSVGNIEPGLRSYNLGGSVGVGEGRLLRNKKSVFAL